MVPGERRREYFILRRAREVLEEIPRGEDPVARNVVRGSGDPTNDDVKVMQLRLFFLHDEAARSCVSSRVVSGRKARNAAILDVDTIDVVREPKRVSIRTFEAKPKRVVKPHARPLSRATHSKTAKRLAPFARRATIRHGPHSDWVVERAAREHRGATR